MTGIILCGHGSYASGMLAALGQLQGVPGHCAAIDFGPGMAQEALEAEMLRRMDEAGWEETIVLTDILGGTPFKAAVTLAVGRPGMRVLTGVNLPVLLQLAVDAQRKGDIDEHIGQAVEDGRFSLQRVDLERFRT